jgi:hypothetical protein
MSESGAGPDHLNRRFGVPERLGAADRGEAREFREADFSELIA